MNIDLDVVKTTTVPQGGTSLNFRYLCSTRQKKWTQSDIRFCENEGSNRFKINEKGSHLDRKYRIFFYTNA